MTTEMENHAIVTTIKAFDSSENNNLVTKTIAHAFGNKYGGIWNCLLGNGNIFGSQLTYQSRAYMIESQYKYPIAKNLEVRKTRSKFRFILKLTLDQK
jgi:hypothetical protein